MRHRRGWGGRGRPPKPIMLDQIPTTTRFTPSTLKNAIPVEINFAELETMRLVDQMGLSQEEAGEKMGVSRGTVWRLLNEGRKKVVIGLTEQRPIIITSQTILQDAPHEKSEKTG
ncbi:MAG: DUF134 domain-containing protein [Candidatus Thorarchaeota archaeon]